ncbi:hypothetical protein LY76DRAFT_211122 [Colletotrichum caudatum]|nr:hypothetical protein LY76DRAFT_211122 [Colletotrichum caudatum]
MIPCPRRRRHHRCGGDGLLRYPSHTHTHTHTHTHERARKRAKQRAGIHFQRFKPRSVLPVQMHPPVRPHSSYRNQILSSSMIRRTHSTAQHSLREYCV